jgi:serine/threonine protein kinase
MQREAEVVTRIRSDRVAQVFEVNGSVEEPYLIMEFVPGLPLDKLVASNGPVTGGLAWAVVDALVEALTHIHQAGVIHRDLKPSNVIVGPNGVKVLDFGISRFVDTASFTEVGSMVGTFVWSSPEQAQGRNVGTPSDVFNLGMVLVFALTGRHPFGNGTRDALMYRIVHEHPDLTGVPSRLALIVERCLSKDPVLRPSAVELLTEVHSISRSSNSSDSGIPRGTNAIDNFVQPLQTMVVNAEREIAQRSESQQPIPPKRPVAVLLLACALVALAGVGIVLFRGPGTSSETVESELPVVTTSSVETLEVRPISDFSDLPFRADGSTYSPERLKIDLSETPRWKVDGKCARQFEVRLKSGGNKSNAVKIRITAASRSEELTSAFETVSKHLSDLGIKRKLAVSLGDGTTPPAPLPNNNNSNDLAKTSAENREKLLSNADVWLFFSDLSALDDQSVTYQSDLSIQRIKDGWQIVDELLPDGFTRDIGWKVGEGNKLCEGKKIDNAIVLVSAENWMLLEGEELLLIVARTVLLGLGAVPDSQAGTILSVKDGRFLRDEYFFTDADKTLVGNLFWEK